MGGNSERELRVVRDVDLTLKLTAEMFEKLTAAQKRAQIQSIHEVVQRALNLYLWTVEQRQEGFSIVARKKSEQTVVERRLAQDF